jgi:predicted transcriptional regulator
MTEVRRLTVSELSLLEGFSVVAMPDGGREIKGVYIGDLLSWVMGRAKADDAWITIMSNINIVAVASLADTACVILAEGVSLDASVVETANAKGVNILAAAMPAYETAMALGTRL